MMIDRRDFIASASLVFVAPVIHLLPSQQPSSLQVKVASFS
jgi:hypothetical protein